MFSGSLVCNDHKFDFVTLLQNLSAFNFARVEEQLLTLVNFVTQETELACRGYKQKYVENPGNEKYICTRCKVFRSIYEWHLKS